MNIITFDKNNGKFEYTTSNLPSLMFDLLYFETEEQNWALRLSGSSLQITFTCLDSSQKLLGKISQPLTPLVSPYQIQPYILFNNYPVRFEINRLFINKHNIDKYKIEIELLGIHFKEDEMYHVHFHMLEHSCYQIFCGGQTIATVFIVDNHPQNPDKRIVTFIPVTTTTHSSTFKTLNFNNHQNYFVSKSMADDQIINDLFSNNKLICSSKWTKIKL